MKADGTTSITLKRPAGGNWSVQEAQPGSVAQVSVARELPTPTVSAKVRGNGRKRVLTYKATSRKDLVVRFYERIGRGARQIAVVKNRSGRVRFNAGDGPGGRRRIEAQVEQGGLPLVQKTVTTYRAPGPIRPARARPASTPVGGLGGDRLEACPRHRPIRGASEGQRRPAVAPPGEGTPRAGARRGTR